MHPRIRSLSLRTLVSRGPSVRGWVLLLLGLFLAGAAAGCATRVAPGWPGIAQDEERLYVSGDSTVVALDPETGQVLWTFPEEGKPLFTAPARVVPLGGGQVLVGDQQGTLYSLDPATGQARWTLENTEHPFIAGVTYNGDTLFAPNSNGTLYALTPDGQVRWTFTAGGPLWADAPVAQGRLYAASMDHYLYALEAETGRLLWKQNLNAAIGAGPLATEDTLFVPTYGAGLYALAPDTGDILWQTAQEAWLWHTPTQGEAVYVGTMDGLLLALNPRTGETLWEKALDGAIVARPTWDRDTNTLYVVTEGGTLWALKADSGDVQWSKQDEAWEKKLYTAPALGQGRLYLVIHTSPPQVLALDPETGQVMWTYSGKK